MKNTKIIKKNYECRYFFKKGKYFSGELLEIFVFKNNDSSNKLGIIVSKKVGGSVIRNKVKRFIREAYKELEDKIDTKNNILIIWKKSVTHEKANFFDTKKDLKNLFEKSGILVEE